MTFSSTDDGRGHNRANLAIERRVAAKIRRQMATLNPTSASRRGMRDAWRDCLRQAAFHRTSARLIAARAAIDGFQAGARP